MKVILSTNNPTKIVQIKAIFTGSPFEILTLAEAGIHGEAVEDGETIEENARKKAWYAYERAGAHVWTMADDTGVFIDALNGEPGAKAARWAGINATTEDTMWYTLRMLLGKKDRSGTFATAAALVSPNGKEYITGGGVRGKFLELPRTKPQPMMPYSPLFVPDGMEKCWAELSTEEENAISHRGEAFRKARTLLEKLAS